MQKNVNQEAKRKPVQSKKANPSAPAEAKTAKPDVPPTTNLSQKDMETGQVQSGTKQAAGTGTEMALDNTVNATNNPATGKKNGGDPPPSQHGPGPGQVTGTLILKDNNDLTSNKPANKIGVKLITGDVAKREFARSETNDKGKFLFEKIPPGDYYLTLPNDLPNNTGYRLCEPLLSSIFVQVFSGAVIDVGEIHYEKKSGLLQGIVFLQGDEDCKPEDRARLSNVPVSLIDPCNHEVVASTVTDAQGRYYFTDLSPRLYLLKFNQEVTTNKIGTGITKLTLSSAAHPPIAFTPGQTKTYNVVYAAPGGEVHGIVFLDQEGNRKRFGDEAGIKGVKVVLVDEQGRTSEQSTNEHGEYLFTSVNPGKYNLRFATLIHNTDGEEFNLTTDESLSLIVIAGERKEVPHAGYTPEIHEIRGQVLYENKEPISGLVVTLTDSEGRFVDSVVTEKDGRYVFKGYEGDFKVVFPDPPFSGQLLSRKELKINAHSISDHNNALYRANPVPFDAQFVTPTGRFDGGIQEAVGDIASYMPTMQSADSTGGSGTIMSRSSNAPLGQIVTNALTEVLGRKLKADDPKALVSSLDRSFTSQEVAGRLEYKWTPRTYAVMTELGGGLSGAQASIYHRAKVALDDALPMLDGLSSLLPDYDPQETEAVRSIVRTEFQELVRELGIEGGPRVQRVDDLFRILGLQLDRLEEEFGFDDSSRINTVEEEQNLTNYLVVRDYILGLEQTWQAFRSQFTGTNNKFLGTQLVLLSRALSVVAEQVDEVKLNMESVFLGPNERQTVRIKFPARITIGDREEDILIEGAGVPPSMLVSELLDWVERLAVEEGPMLVKDGGRIGINSIEQTVKQLQRLVLGAAQAKISHIGFSRQRVRRSLEELAAQLGEVAQLAAGVNLNNK